MFRVLFFLIALISAIVRAEEPLTSGADAVISRDFLRTAVSQPVDKISPLSVSIDKYRVLGMGHISGSISFEPLPADDRIRLQMTLTGQAIGCDRTLVRSLQVHTLDRSELRVRQELLVSPTGIEAGPPAIEASARSQLLRIETHKPPLRDLLVRGVARAKFRATPAQNDQLATAVSQIALTEEVEHDAPETLAAANRTFREKLLDPLSATGISANQLHLSSSAKGISARLDYSLPGRKQPPSLSDGIDVGLRVHQDSVNQIAQRSLAGSTVHGQELEKLLNRLYQLMNVAPARIPDGRPWSIVLAKKDPMVVRFERNQIELTIHGEEYSIGAEKYPASDIVLRFSIQQTAKGWRTLRQFPSVTAPSQAASNKDMDRRRLALIVFLAKKLADLIPIEIDVTNLRLPPPLPQTAKGQFTRALASDGWLLLEWQLAR